MHQAITICEEKLAANSNDFDTQKTKQLALEALEDINPDCTFTATSISSDAAEPTEGPASQQEDAHIMGKEKQVNLSQTQSNVPSTIAYTESPTEKATTATTSESQQTSEIAAAIQPLTTIAKLPTAIEPQRPHCPVYCHTRKIEERFETQFKQLYGEELYETILQTFLAFDASLNKMNREIQLKSSVSRFPKKVYQLIKKLSGFKTLYEIDCRLKDSHKCDDGLKDFLCFALNHNQLKLVG